MTDIDLTAAKMEAARRWPSRNIRDPLSSDWLNEGMASGFVLGTQWALAQVEARVKPTREDAARALSVADVHHPDFCDCGDFDAAQWCDGLEQQIDAVLALRPGKTEQEIRADMLDALIDGYFHGDANRFTLPDSVIQWLGAQPEYKARYARGGERG